MCSICPRGHNSARKVGREQRWRPFRAGITNHLRYNSEAPEMDAEFDLSQLCYNVRFRENFLFILHDEKIASYVRFDGYYVS